MHDDPVIDYLIMEAVMVAVKKEDADLQAAAEKEAEKLRFREESKQRLKQVVHGK